MNSIRHQTCSLVAGLPTAPALFLVLASAVSPAPASAQDTTPRMPVIELVTDDSGTRLRVDGEDMMVQGVNWDYFPIGTTYNYNFWTEPDHIIEAALEREMSLLKAMGGNAIRTYAGITPRWVRHIYERYGIFTILNHAMGRYGVAVRGVFSANTDYSDPRARAQVMAEIEEMVNEFRDTPGLLMWLLGNENNYGLVWSSAETEDLPEGEANAVRARHMYSLFGDVARSIKEMDPTRPIAMANGDLQYLDIIAEEVPDLDIFGTNVYRGISFGQLFQEVREKLDRPVMFTEFGADVWNAKDMREDQVTQAKYLIGQWREIYEQSAGKGLVGNSIGGLTFQWSDGWWKFGQESRLDIQDTNASWANGGYVEDFVEGRNNMNEEWWGIVAKGSPDHNRLYELYPRAAYYALQQAYTLDPYAPGTDLAAVRDHFAAMQPAEMGLRALGDRAALLAMVRDRVHLSGVRIELETFSTGGSLVSTPEEAPERNPAYPSFRGFDKMQSFYADLTAQPVKNMLATVSFNVLGDVPTNPINEIFYENRGRPRNVRTDGGDVALHDIERLKVYNANVSWDDEWFNLQGFYRTGHYHWGYEGDFFGLYQEANYGPNIDLYNGVAPVGMEFTGKLGLNGLKVAIGPELWWGANPAMLAKYQTALGPLETTAIFQEDLAAAGSAAASSFAIPLPPTRKATLHLAATSGGATFEVEDPFAVRGNRETRAAEILVTYDPTPATWMYNWDSDVREDASFAASLGFVYFNFPTTQDAAIGIFADGRTTFPFPGAPPRATCGSSRRGSCRSVRRRRA